MTKKYNKGKNTTIQIKGPTRRNLKSWAAKKGLNYNEAIEELLNKEEVWIETYEEIFPDFIACDLGSEIHHRPPLKKYIKMTEDFDKLKDIYKITKGSLWNAFAKTQFYGKINTFLFTNVATFNVYHNGKRIITEQFRSNWETFVINLIENKKEMNYNLEWTYLI